MSFVKKEDNKKNSNLTLSIQLCVKFLAWSFFLKFKTHSFKDSQVNDYISYEQTSAHVDFIEESMIKINVWTIFINIILNIQYF